MSPSGISGQGPVRIGSAPATPTQPDPGNTAPSGATKAVTVPAGTASPTGSVSPSGPHRLTGQPSPSGPSDGRRGWRNLDRRLLPVLGRLTERDRSLCRLLEDHRVLTTAQVADVAFTGERRARMRLGELYALDLLDRFRPRTAGNPAPYHWVLGPLGAALVAAEHGVDVAELDWRRGLVHDLAASQRLTHLVGLNGFFTALLRAARSRPGCSLVEWWSERRCSREWGEVVRPDGYAIWTEGATTLPFLYEHDNGTERLARLAGKLDGYARLAAEAGHPNWVLFTFPSLRREADSRRVLVHPAVPVATAARPSGFAPDGAVWQPVTARGPRLTLAQLAHTPMEVT
jgi:hypothetical protein